MNLEYLQVHEHLLWHAR